MVDWQFLSAESPASARAEMGGKAANLHRLAQAGLPVPRWLCLPANCFREVFAAVAPQLAECSPAELQRQGPLLLAEHFPLQGLQQQLDALWGSEADDAYYAVRSSALGEDSARDSFAGQFETYLYVPRDDIARFILRCWQSIFAPHVQSYLRERGRDGLQMPMAVVVQEMIASQAAGVMFMANPVGALSEVVINAGYGLGEGVVSDMVETDSYSYDRFSQKWNRQIQRKRFQVLGNPLGGTEKLPVPEGLQARPVLDVEQCQTLLELGDKVSQLYSHYQDIEWAIDAQERFWLLQSRPITTLAEGEKTLFDNSNVVESYPGLTQPLTYAYIRGGYEVIFRQGVQALGVPTHLVEGNRQGFENMVGHLHGRVYYNLTHWYRMFRLLPGIEPYIRVWEEMMGIAQADRAEAMPAHWLRYLLPWSRIALRVLGYFLSLERRLKRFQRKCHKIFEAFWQRDKSSLSAQALLGLYQQSSDQLLKDWEITILNDGYAFIFSALSKAILTRAGMADADALFNDLLCGVEGMESVEPIRSVVMMAEQARESAALQTELQAQRQDYQPERLRRDFPALWVQFELHLQAYGDRSLAELKLETVTLREDPRLLVKWILDYVETDLSVEGMQSREAQIREQAEARVRQGLKLWWRPVFAFCLRQARRCINFRESSRLDRARATGLVRRLFILLGEQLYHQQILPDARDVFWLSLDELQAIVYAAGPRQDWPQVVAQRKADYARWEQERLPPRILCQGPVGTHMLPVRRELHTRPGDGVLHGTGCAPGVVEAEAVVVRDPQQVGEVKGKILVAEMTDPGWVFLMLQAKGLVVEKGSLLSHTAIIGRELGIPTVVGVELATRQVQDGQRLRLDGQNGEVHLL